MWSQIPSFLVLACCHKWEIPYGFMRNHGQSRGVGQEWQYTPIVPATHGVEARGSHASMISRPAWIITVRNTSENWVSTVLKALYSIIFKLYVSDASHNINEFCVQSLVLPPSVLIMNMQIPKNHKEETFLFPNVLVSFPVTTKHSDRSNLKEGFILAGRWKYRPPWWGNSGSRGLKKLITWHQKTRNKDVS